MTEALAVEWSRVSINVNAIAPGAVRLGDDGRHDVANRRSRRPSPASAWATRPTSTTLLYLVSPASEAVTGTVIRVDDGQGPR